MRRRLLRWLACPLCHGKLNLIVAQFERREVSQSDYAVFEATARVEQLDEIKIEIITGALTCKQCSGVTPIDWTVKRAKLERGEEFLGSIFFSLLRRFVFPFSVVFRHAVEKRLSHLPYNARSHTG